MKFARALVVPCAICALTFALALIMAIAGGVSGTEILGDYAMVSLLTTVTAFVLWMMIPWLRDPQLRHLGPITAAGRMISERWLLLILPLAIFPTFMTGFTVSKISFPLFTSFHWDQLWTAADAALFGEDPWRITHRLIGIEGSEILSISYTIVWGMTLALVPALYAFSARPAAVIRAYTALMTTWFTVGVAGASVFSSAGPVFADLVDPALGQHFAPLRHSLATLLPPDNGIIRSQAYLRSAFDLREAVRAGGISAMPSMHLAAWAWLVIIAWNSMWRILAIAMWGVIWIGSVHLGYHYALDGVIGAAIAWLCWKVTAPRPFAVSYQPPFRLAAA